MTQYLASICRSRWRNDRSNWSLRRANDLVAKNKGATIPALATSDLKAGLFRLVALKLLQELILGLGGEEIGPGIIQFDPERVGIDELLHRKWWDIYCATWNCQFEIAPAGLITAFADNVDAWMRGCVLGGH